MSPDLVGILLGVGIWFAVAVKSAQRRNREAAEAAAEAKLRAEAQAEEMKSRPKKNRPLGSPLKKPVFLPTEADSLLQADPMIEWQPVQMGRRTAYMNPQTGELVELGDQKEAA